MLTSTYYISLGVMLIFLGLQPYNDKGLGYFIIGVPLFIFGISLLAYDFFIYFLEVLSHYLY